MDKRIRERRRLVNRERGRRRAGLIFLCLLVVVAAVAFLWLRSSSVFAVKQISAPVTHHVTQEQIATAVATARGTSLLAVSTRGIEKKLLALPYVRSAHVYRDFPNGLEIRIAEYEPAARVRGGNSRIWLVAEDGRLLERAGTQPGSPLPLIVTGDQFEARAGSTVPASVLAAIPVARMLDRPTAPLGLPGVDRITVSGGGDVLVHLEGGAELRLGQPNDLKRKMTVAAEIIEKYLRDGRTLEYVDASAADRPAAKAK